MATDKPVKTWRRVLCWVLVVAWMAVIFSFSAQDTTASHGSSNRVVRVVASFTVDGFDQMTDDQQAIVIKSLDYPVRKSGHLSEYAMLGILTFIAFGTVARMRQRLGLRFLASLGLVFAYACTDEFHQLFTFGRTASFGDVLIDTFGALVAMIIACGVRALWLSRRDGTA